MPLGLSLPAYGQQDGLARYAVLGFTAKVASDFVNEFYYANGGGRFSDTITHTRSGNATMTGDYGPELVTNGDFSDGGTGWVVNGEDSTHFVTFENGTARYVSDTTSPILQFFQSSILEVGKTYEVTVSCTQHHGGSLKIDTGTGPAVFAASVGVTKVTLTAINASFNLYRNSTNVDVTLDSISVREVPKIQWAPHNLLTYSEDFSASDWTKSNATITTNATAAPDGTTTADKIVPNTSSNVTAIATEPVSVTSGQKYTISFYAKASEKDWVRFGAGNSPFGAGGYTTDRSVYFNLAGGVVGTIGSTFDSASILSVGSGWYLCICVGTAVSTTTLNYDISPAHADLDADYSGAGDGIYVWGAHLYRSDLGGMANNPDRGDSYVPTTSAAVYLPRRGHHVYNGSQWVNKGLLHESEARTNLVTEALDLTAWLVTGAPVITDNGDGSFDVEDNSSSYEAPYSSMTVTSGTATYCAAVDVKKTTGGTSKTVGINFQLSGGTTVSNNVRINSDTGVSLYGPASVEDHGNYWRVSSTITDNASGNNTLRFYLYPATDDHGGSSDDPTVVGTATFRYPQVEVGSTPSSFIPTSGSTVTRPAETLTIPSANLPWPSPQYVTGEELVTNGTFDTDTSGWTPNSVPEAPLSIDGQKLKVTTYGTGKWNYGYQVIPTEVNKVYRVQGDFVAGTATSGRIFVGTSTQNNAYAGITSAGTLDEYFVATTTTTYITLQNTDGVTGSTNYFDNISVKEINPLALSIQMKGEMTYADNGVAHSSAGKGGEAVFWTQHSDSSNYIEAVLSTNAAKTGTLFAQSEANGTNDTAKTGDVTYSPDINVPFNISSRHGSTFVQGAADGTATTENTTPVALPDLENIDLQLGYRFMGTIDTFRMWEDDLGDTGIADATS